MDNSYEPFDKHIRAKLGNIDIPGAPEGWDILQQKIAADADLNPAIESSDPFDEMIKSKLESSNAAYDPGFWSLMESQIEADADLTVPELKDVQLDGLIYENLNYYQAPYNPSHWELMAKRIREEFSIQHKLYRYKVAEISLMLLAILTLIQFFPGHGNSRFNNTNLNAPQAGQFIENPQADLNSETMEDATFTVSNTTNTESNKLESNDTPVIASAKKIEKNIEDSNFNSTNSNAIASKSNGDETTPFLLPELEIRNSGTSISNQRISLNASSQRAKGEATSIIAEASEADELLSQNLMDLLTLESTPMEEFAYSDSEEYLPACVLCKLKKPSFYKLGMITGLDLNLVMTPYDEYFSSASYDQLTSGYTGGISFGIFHGRWGINTGFIYASKNYEPTENVNIEGSLQNGYTGEGLTAAQLNIISAPLNLSYTFDNTGKWQWYALAGASAKLAAVNNFDFKTFAVGKPVPQDPNFPGPSRPAEEEPPMEEEPIAGPYDGIFEGGSFKDNLFLTTNVGFGMERYFNPRWSIFIQPTYQHYLYKRGLGPNNDRIHTMSLYFGTRATLR